MLVDACGLPATTSRDALTAYDEGLRRFIAMSQGGDALVATALEHDPRFALARAAQAVMAFAQERFDEALEAIEAAREAAKQTSERERQHIEVLGLYVEGSHAQAEIEMRRHLDQFPADLLVAQRLFFLCFWQGRYADCEPTLARLVSALPGPFSRGLHAFAVGQCGQHEQGLAEAELALAEGPENAWAVHTVAHLLHETGAFEEGVRRLPSAIHRTQPELGFRTHLLWHLGLMQLALGDFDGASAVSRTVFEAAPPESVGNLDDGIALLWRLHVRGLARPERWTTYLGPARRGLSRQRLPFFQAHVAMALAINGDWEAAAQQLATLSARGRRDPRTAELLIPLIEALHRFARGEFGPAADQLEALRPRLGQLGGTREQGEVFDDTLIAAALGLGDVDRARRYAARRFALRQSWPQLAPASR